MIEKSEASNGHVHEHQIEPEISAFVAFLTYGNYLLMIVVSYLIKVYFCVLQARYKQGRKMVYKGSWLYTLHTHTLTLRHTHIHPKRHNQIGHIRDFCAMHTYTHTHIHTIHTHTHLHIHIYTLNVTTRSGIFVISLPHCLVYHGTKTRVYNGKGMQVYSSHKKAFSQEGLIHTIYTIYTIHTI